MTELFIWLVFLAIWYAILIPTNGLGINVILLIAPLICFLIYTLKINKKIKNKYGLLFIIPIVILSLNYVLLNIPVFKILNILVIPILFTLMYVYTIKPTYNLNDLLTKIILLFMEPFSCISKVINLLIGNKNKPKKKSKDYLSFLIIIPVVLVVIFLLASADAEFSGIFTNLFDRITLPKLSENFFNILFRIIVGIIFFLYLSAVTNYLIFNFQNKKEENNKILKISSDALKILLAVLNIIYVVFDVIQIKSLILHQTSMDITYAEYARQGFFQLMLVSAINIVVILLTKSNETKKDTTYNKAMCITMILLTLIIIISSFIRMNMYESAYGCTMLRVLVYISLIVEIILLIPTIIYILNKKINILKYYLIILVSSYSFINLLPLNNIIAERNINRYYNNHRLDVDYLKELDCYPKLIELHDKTQDSGLKTQLELYIKVYQVDNNIFEFNLSDYINEQKVEEFKNR